MLLLCYLLIMSKINKQYDKWLEDCLKEIDANNKIHTVKIRHRSGVGGVTLFTAHWNGQKWENDFLKPRLTGDKEKDMETLRRANSIRDEKEKRIGQDMGDEFDSKQTLIAVIDKDMKCQEKNRFGIKINRQGLKSVRNHIEQFTQGQPLPLKRVDAQWVKRFQGYLQTKISNNSAASYMILLHAVLSRLQEDGWERNPNRKKYRLKYEKKDRTFLTEDEVSKMAEIPCNDAEVKRAFLFSCFAGLRFGDVKNLKWENIVEAENNKFEIKFIQQKTNKLTNLPLGQGAVNQLFANRDEKIIPLPEIHVFDLPGKTWVGKCLKAWARAAGIKKQISYHTSRHTFAMAGVKKHIDILLLKELLGHSSVKTTEIYVRNIPSDLLREAVDKFQDHNIGHRGAK